MKTIGIILTAIATLSMIGAIVCQRIDHTNDRGNTMGGEMTVGAIWSFAALLGGIGLGSLTKWYWGSSVFPVIYIMSFFIRRAVERILRRIDRQSSDRQAEQRP